MLACSVFEREIALHARGAEHIAEVRFFEMGLHDRPDLLRATLQENLDAVDSRTDIEAVVLAYGLCGRGTARLRPLRHKLVIPRAHDCITVFMSSKEAYVEHQRRFLISGPMTRRPRRLTRGSARTGWAGSLSIGAGILRC